MGFAAWWLNLDSAAGPAPSVGIPVPGLRVMGTIIESYTNPYLRYLDDIRLKKLKCHKQRICIRRAMNPAQFAYQLNASFNHKAKLKTIIGFKHINIFDIINYRSTKKEPIIIDNPLIRIRPVPSKKIRVKLMGLNRKERDLTKQDFDLDKFLEFTPSKRSLKSRLFL